MLWPFSNLYLGSTTGPRSPLFALIIGINEYSSPNIRNLKGAVPDALAVKKYLESNLGVPSSQIRLLCNAQATRKAIIQEFMGLAADPRIHHGDPVLVFYAGHGGEVVAPKEWGASDPRIQLLIPHDFCNAIDGPMVHGIPIHRTLDALLFRVAERCGDNIVCGSRHYASTRMMDFTYRRSSLIAVTVAMVPLLLQTQPVSRESLIYQMVCQCPQAWTERFGTIPTVKHLQSPLNLVYCTTPGGRTFVFPHVGRMNMRMKSKEGGSLLQNC